MNCFDLPRQTNELGQLAPMSLVIGTHKKHEALIWIKAVAIFSRIGVLNNLSMLIYFPGSKATAFFRRPGRPDATDSLHSLKNPAFEQNSARPARSLPRSSQSRHSL